MSNQPLLDLDKLSYYSISWDSPCLFEMLHYRPFFKPQTSKNTHLYAIFPLCPINDKSLFLIPINKN